MFFSDEIETDNPDAYIAGMFAGCRVEAEPGGAAGPTRIYEIEADGLRQRVSLTEL